MDYGNTINFLGNLRGRKQTYEYAVFMEEKKRYAHLEKPSWAPPDFVFGPVWTVLYIGIVISFGSVFLSAAQQAISWMIALPFILNLIANISYTPLQFGLKSNTLASVDILIVLGTLIWAMIVIYPFSPLIMWAQIPYLLWVSFATVLQLTITYLNAK